MDLFIFGRMLAAIQGNIYLAKMQLVPLPPLHNQASLAISLLSMRSTHSDNLLKAIRQLDKTIPAILLTGYDKGNVLDISSQPAQYNTTFEKNEFRVPFATLFPY